jgi:Type II secretory pathway, ATPase PulE/Tfp pilus assembly pathway, ATPase PilB
MPPRLTLEELLVQHGLLTEPELIEVAKKAKRAKMSIEQVIREANLVYPEPLAQLKAESLSLPYVDLKNSARDPAAMEGVAAKASKKQQFFFFGQNDDALRVAMANPTDGAAYEAVNYVAGQKKKSLEVYLASPESIEWALTDEHKQEETDTQSEISAALAEVGSKKDIDKLISTLEEAPVNKVFAVIMRHAIEGLASDIHIEPMATKCGSGIGSMGSFIPV